MRCTRVDRDHSGGWLWLGCATLTWIGKTWKGGLGLTVVQDTLTVTISIKLVRRRDRNKEKSLLFITNCAYLPPSMDEVLSGSVGKNY